MYEQDQKTNQQKKTLSLIQLKLCWANQLNVLKVSEMSIKLDIHTIRVFKS